jgi:predicted phage tail protein
MSTLKLATTLVAIRAAANVAAPVFLKADGDYPLVVTGIGPVWKSGPTFQTTIGAVPIAELCSTTNASVVSALFPGGDSTDTVTLGVSLTVTIAKGRIVTAAVKAATTVAKAGKK